MLRFDMSEFKDYSSFEKLIGDPHADDRSAMRSGSLLSRVREQPFSVILLDEIEKAHPNIYDLLLQLFDDGRLSDPTGQTTNFTQTIIVMTSNLGGEISEGGPFGIHADVDPVDQLEASVREALKGSFRPELLNRIDNIVMFRPLGREHVRRIAQRELGQVLLRSGITRRQLRVDVEEGVIDILADAGFDPRYGARPLKRAVERLALLPIARQLVKFSDQQRPALLRLVPNGKRLGLTFVYDRQSRKSESLARGVTVADKARGMKVRLKPAQLKAQHECLNELVQSLENECQQRELAKKKTEMVQRTSHVDFWDDAKGARETLTDLYRIERVLEAVARVRRHTTDLDELLGAAYRSGSERQLTKAAERLLVTQQHCEILQYSLHCRSQLDRCDAFLEITAVDQAKEDLGGNLVDMYMNWARGKGFQARIVHEELSSPKVSRKIIVLIEGVAIYGLLCGEQGLHEFVYGKTSKTSRQLHYVKVNVLPIVEELPSGGSDVWIEQRNAHGAGQRCKRYRSEIQATHRASRLSLTVRSDLDKEKAADLVGDLVLAQRRWIDTLAESNSQAESRTDESVVRRYTLRPSQLAKDSRTGVTTRRLSELWNGAIDPFLSAVLKQRNSAE